MLQTLADYLLSTLANAERFWAARPALAAHSRILLPTVELFPEARRIFASRCAVATQAVRSPHCCLWSSGHQQGPRAVLLPCRCPALLDAQLVPDATERSASVLNGSKVLVVRDASWKFVERPVSDALLLCGSPTLCTRHDRLRQTVAIDHAPGASRRPGLRCTSTSRAWSAAPWAPSCGCRSTR